MSDDGRVPDPAVAAKDEAPRRKMFFDPQMSPEAIAAALIAEYERERRPATT